MKKAYKNEYRQRYLAKKTSLVSARKSAGCQVCRYKGHHNSLDFHHVDPAEKQMSINKRLRSGSVEDLAKELAKCVVLCANCHRNVHAGEINLVYASSKHKKKLRIDLNV